MKETSDFGKFLKEIRASHKLSVRALSENASVSHSYLSQVENGNRGVPSPEVIRKIAAALDYDYFSLMRAAGYMTVDTNKDFLVDSNKDIFSEDIISTMFQSITLDQNKSRKPYARNSNIKSDKIKILFKYPRIVQLNDEEIELSEEEAKERFLYLENLLTMDDNIYLNSRVLSKSEKEKALQLLKLVFDKTTEETE